MIKKIVFLLLISSSLSAQNLVPNPSFEDTVFCVGSGNCPMHLGGTCNIKYWDFASFTPDYFNRCDSSMAVSIPDNIMGTQEINHGNNAYIGLFTRALGYTFPNYREIIGIQLSDSLSIGGKYFLSLKVSLADSSNCSSNKIGILFSTNPIAYSVPVTLPNKAHVYSSNIISDTSNWVTISGSIVADSAYKYIFIGNFFDDANTDTVMRNVHPCNPSYCPDSNICHAYYYVDDICVSVDPLTCEISTDIGHLTKVEVIKVWLDQGTDILRVELPQPMTLFIHDVIGRDIYSILIPDTKFNLNISSFSNGIYFLTARNKSALQTVKILVQR